MLNAGVAGEQCTDSRIGQPLRLVLSDAGVGTPWTALIQNGTFIESRRLTSCGIGCYVPNAIIRRESLT